MGELDLSVSAQHWLNLALIWIGFGTVAGVLAATLVPGPRRGGVFAVVVIGIAGSTLGPLGLTWLWPRDQFNPISPLGMVAAVAGALVLLLVYQVVARALPAPRTERDQEEIDEDEDDGDEEDDRWPSTTARGHRRDDIRILNRRRPSTLR